MTASLSAPSGGSSIDATIDAGGIPELRFERLRRHRKVWLWVDGSSAGLLARRLAEDVEIVLDAHGLDAEIARFWGTPTLLELDGGRQLAPHDMEEDRQGTLVVVLTDGAALLRRTEGDTAERKDPPTHRLLRDLSHWPHLGLVHVGEDAQRRALGDLLKPYGIPCLEPRALPAFLGGHGQPPEARFASDDWGSAWLWAACCAISPLPAQELDALALRRELDLPMSPYALRLLRSRSVSRTHIQFSQAERTSLLRRLRRAFSEPDGSASPLLLAAVDFWRRRFTEAAGPDWQDDTTGRGHHLRLLAALLDLWHDPERAAEELHGLQKSPHFADIQRELAAYEPSGGQGEGIDLPFAPQDLDEMSAAKLGRAGLGGAERLPEPDAKRALRGWRGVMAGWAGIFAGVVAGWAVIWAWPSQEVTVDTSQPAVSELRTAVPLTLRAVEGKGGTEWALHVYVKGDFEPIATMPGGSTVEIGKEKAESFDAPCAKDEGDLGFRRCVAELRSGEPTGRVAEIAAPPGDRDAERLGAALMRSGNVDAVWFGGEPPWPDEVVSGADASRLPQLLKFRTRDKKGQAPVTARVPLFCAMVVDSWAAALDTLYRTAGRRDAAEVWGKANTSCTPGAEGWILPACGGEHGPEPEVCDGRDNDCDGQVDEGVANACGGCGDVPEETCNEKDDDCDGETDEGWVCGKAKLEGGQLMAAVTFAPTGKVASVSVKSSSIDDKQVESCVIRELEQLTPDSWAGTACTAELPFIFTPADAAAE